MYLRHTADKDSSDRKPIEEHPVTNPHRDCRGTCAAYGGKKQHAVSCFFLQKIELILKFLAEQRTISKEFRKEYYAKTDSKIAISRSLQSVIFILDTYRLLDPAIFVDAM